MLELNKIYCRSAEAWLKQIDSDSIDLTVTSPPYDNLRTYNGFTFDFKSIAKELYRVTKQGGVVVWVVGDATINGSETGTSFEQALYFKKIGFNLHDTMIYERSATYPANDKSNRYTQTFEYMFILSKGKPKTSSLIRDRKNKWGGFTSFGTQSERLANGKLKKRKRTYVSEIGIRFNIWKYAAGKNMSTKDKIAFQHPAIFPEKLAEDHILSWSNEEDIVLDPLCGSGTTCKMALKNKRNFIGIEINPDYVDIANKRLANTYYQTELIK